MRGGIETRRIMRKEDEGDLPLAPPPGGGGARSHSRSREASWLVIPARPLRAR